MKFSPVASNLGYGFWCKSYIYRQLSTEQAVLQESLEKESKVNKRLSMENEELLWKLHNGDLCSPRKLSPSSPSVPLQSPRNSGSFSSPAVSPRWHLLRERRDCSSSVICRTNPNFNHRSKSCTRWIWQLRVTGNSLVQNRREETGNMGVRHSCWSSPKYLFMTSMDIVAQSTYRARKDLFIAFSPNCKKKLRGLEIKITTFIVCSLSQTLF